MTHLSPQEQKNIVIRCEARFEADLDAVAAAVVATQGLRTLSITGPTCAGKTTTANKVIDALQRHGRRVQVVSIDDFYRNRACIEDGIEPEDVDFETIAAIDLAYLTECVEKILAGSLVRLPKYKFATGSRVGYEEYVPARGDIILFEGIQAIYPEVTALFPQDNVSIFINTRRNIRVGETTFEPREIRLIRRLVRDRYFRDATPEFSFFLWDKVVANEDTSILPYAEGCTHIIDSAMEYEPGMMRPHLERVLAAVPQDSKYYPKTAEILAKIATVQSISCEYLPEKSVYREFLG